MVGGDKLNRGFALNFTPNYPRIIGAMHADPTYVYYTGGYSFITDNGKHIDFNGHMQHTCLSEIT